MVRYRVRSPSERPQSGPGQQHGGEDQGQESGHTPENIEAAWRTAGSYYRYRRRRCSPRRLYRLRRRRYRSSRRRRRRPCRRRRHRRGGGEDAEGGTSLPGPPAPGWKLRESHLPKDHLSRPQQSPPRRWMFKP
ncbi:LOW QUALITY PROTEIN: protamine-2 [Equus quagga]|uniref:LOW QUALITY PROTEIN: protamine-2 n=1 Tax=Equus quagga TaxID=89248 RepID=UPI001EE2A266|nr:LOW QUALITY PROTEIN: protamine-2 [Equus quagga]